MKRKALVILVCACMALVLFVPSTSAAADEFVNVPLSTVYGVAPTTGNVSISDTVDGLIYTVETANLEGKDYPTFTDEFSSNLSKDHFLVIKVARADFNFRVMFKVGDTEVDIGNWQGHDEGAHTFVFDLSDSSYGVPISDQTTSNRIALVLGPSVWLPSASAVGDKLVISDVYLTDSATHLKASTSDRSSSAVSTSDNSSSATSAPDDGTASVSNSSQATANSETTPDTGDRLPFALLGSLPVLAAASLAVHKAQRHH